ncbi:MAG: hypothetical protein EBT09_09690 [Actinobacteria bacterium]|nr:hypothetical protein [Actinomycetota bacterium]
MRRDERKGTGARGVSNYRQETNMKRRPSKTVDMSWHEGWRLASRDSFPLMTGNRHCTVCGGAADVLWRSLDNRGEEVEVIPVCLNHSDRFERDTDDPRLLVRTDTTAPRGMVITRDELADYLHHCHFIALQRGLTSASHWKFTRFNHSDLMKQLQALRAVKRSDHFSGWEPREGFIQATLLRNGTWEALIKVGKSGKKVVVRSKRQVKLLSPPTA